MISCINRCGPCWALGLTSQTTDSIYIVYQRHTGFNLNKPEVYNIRTVTIDDSRYTSMISCINRCGPCWAMGIISQTTGSVAKIREVTIPSLPTNPMSI